MSTASVVRMDERLTNFCQEYCQDLNATKAAQRAGFRWPGAGMSLIRRIDCRIKIAELLAARSHRLTISADDVLSVLWQRIQLLLNADIAQLKDEDGNWRPVQEWPEWARSGGVVGWEERELFGRSTDGEVKDPAGRKSWDVIGKVTKIKIADLNKLLTAMLELAGKHTAIHAWHDNASAEDIAANVMSEIDKRISEGRQRAARRLTE